MALERKPVEETQDPGYPSTNEYVTGRRAFIGLLGLTALGVGGVYALKSRALVGPPGEPPRALPSAGPTSLPAAQLEGEAAAPKAQPPGQVPAPQASVSGNIAPPKPIQSEATVDGGLKPVRPQAPLKGDVAAPELPARPEAEIEGETYIEAVVAPPKPPEAKPAVRTAGVPVRPQPPAQPDASAAGGIRAPVKP